MSNSQHHNAEADSVYYVPEEGIHEEDQSRLQEQNISIKMFLSGGIAGATSKTLTAPLGRLTILYQTQGFEHLGSAPRLDRAFIYVLKNQGLLSFWRGNLATILHRLPYSSASFMTYEYSLSALQWLLPKEEEVITGRTDLLRRLIGGALAGGVSTVIAYPIDLVRTRLAAQTRPDYKGIWDVLRRTYVEENILGLYKGLGGSLVQVMPNVAVNLCSYETLRSYWLSHSTDPVSPGMLGSVVCGGLSGVISSTVTYPIDLVRRRMQLQGLHGAPRQYQTYTQAVQHIWGQGGFRSFYRGIAAEYAKVRFPDYPMDTKLQ